uniref:RRM domain-containing protein n=1 Tax=Panstrongylus megistus TaxID=65343 RepID=A0A069DX97_9HEMI
MSVIIRLQNLPWSANAADIRAYFSGLSIPEGGVHIVGGEQGDAFIAFSTDEDARQAMLLDGGKLKEIKIKLFLSSRTEMLKIIEQARQQAIKLQTLIANPQSSQPLPQSNQGAAGNDETKDSTQEVGYRVKEKDDDTNSRRDRKDRSSSRDRGRVRGRSKEGDRSRDRSRGRDRRDRERDRRRRDRSRSRDRYRNRRSRSRDRKRGPRGESKDDHRGGRHSRDSDVEKNDTSCSKNEGNQSWEVQQQPPPQQHPKPALLPDPPLPQMLLQMQQNGKDPAQSTMQQSGVNFPTDQERRHFPGHPQMPPMGNFPGMPPMRGREGWPPMVGPMGPMPVPLDPSQMPLQRPPLLMPDMPLSSFPPPAFPTQAMYSAPSSHPEGFDPMWRMMAQHSESNHDSSTADADACVEIRGLPLNVSYIDLKKLFDGLNIPLEGIKMINDNQGNRTGIAYVKFSNASQKKSALNQHGKKVRSNIVEVMHLRDDLFRAAVDNFKPEKDAIVKAVDMDIDNGESNDVVWPKDNRRDRGRERKFQDPYRINPALDYKRQDPRQEGRQDPRSVRGDRSERPDRSEREPRPDRLDNQDRMDRPDRMDRSDRQERMGRMDRQQDRMDRLEVSNSVLIKGLPPQCSERDILDFFSELGVAPLNIHLLQDNVGQSSHSEAYCQFETDEEADKSVSKNGANMGRFVVSVEKVSQDQFLRATGQWKLPVPYQQNPMPPLLPLPPQYHQYRMGHEEKGSDRPLYGNDERYQKGDKGNRGNYGMNERYNSRMGGDSGGGGNMRGGRGGEGRGGLRGRSRFSAGPPPLLGNSDLSMSGPMGGHRPPRGGGGGPGPGPGGPYIDGDVVEHFGKPGCVVALENLHFRADIEEIIGLFNDFEIEHEDVIRRFDDRGRPTGDARVCLKNPSEAMRAVRQLAYSQLRGRTIKVSLLQ